jgi:prevent-host-death family protein
MMIKSKTKKRTPKNRAVRKEPSMIEQKIQERLTVGVRELRQDASGVLRLVKNGKSITITEHGKPIAQLTPLVNPVLSDYVNAGVITPAVRKYDPKIDKPLPNPDGIDLVAQLLQDRARI